METGSVSSVSDWLRTSSSKIHPLIRYGPGVTKEVGFDFKNMKAKKVLLLTDKNLSSLPPVQQAMESLGTFSKIRSIIDQSNY